MTPGSALSLGILMGVILTVFCMWCLDGEKTGEVKDSEVEAWREHSRWNEEWKKQREDGESE